MAMAIVDDAEGIRRRLHEIRRDEALVASGADLDRLGLIYSSARELAEHDIEFRTRVVARIDKVMRDEAAQADKIAFFPPLGWPVRTVVLIDRWTFGIYESPSA